MRFLWFLFVGLELGIEVQSSRLTETWDHVLVQVNRRLGVAQQRHAPSHEPCPVGVLSAAHSAWPESFRGRSCFPTNAPAGKKQVAVVRPSGFWFLAIDTAGPSHSISALHSSPHPKYNLAHQRYGFQRHHEGHSQRTGNNARFHQQSCVEYSSSSFRDAPEHYPE